MQTISFMQSPDGTAWGVAFDYEADVIAILKVVVPREHRQWVRQAKTWLIIGTDHARDLARELISRGYGVYGIDPAPPRSDGWALELLTAAPEDIRPRLVRSLAKVLHPDVGGSTVLMQALNTAAEDVGVGR